MLTRKFNLIVCVAVLSAAITAGCGGGTGKAGGSDQSQVVTTDSATTSTQAEAQPTRMPTAGEFHKCLLAEGDAVGVQVNSTNGPYGDGALFTVNALVPGTGIVNASEFVLFASSETVVSTYMRQNPGRSIRGMPAGNVVLLNYGSDADASRPYLDGFNDAQQQVFNGCMTVRESSQSGEGGANTQSATPSTSTQEADKNSGRIPGKGRVCGDVTAGGVTRYGIFIPGVGAVTTMLESVNLWTSVGM